MTALPPIITTNDISMQLDWNTKLRSIVNKLQKTVTWESIDKSNSNIADIVHRNHNDLNSIQGGTTDEYYHLTLAQQNKVETLLSGITDTIVLAKITSGGTNGSMTIVNGIVTGYTAPT